MEKIIKPNGFAPYECMDESADFNFTWKNSPYPHIKLAIQLIHKLQNVTGWNTGE